MANVAQTILEQLGGNRFGAMTRAAQFVDTGNGVQFSIGPGAKRGINKVKITLTAADTYAAEFWKISNSGLQMQHRATVNGVYADRLAEVFTENTGFDTCL